MDAYETSIYNAVFLTGVILGCIILYFIWSVTRHQRRFIDLQRSYFLNEVRLLERERARIAKDLHDELGPMVSVSKMHLQLLEPDDEKMKQILARAIENTELLMKRMEEIMNDLTPGALRKKGLAFVLEDFMDDVQATQKLMVDFSFSGIYTGHESIHIYRIVKELVHNCLKHAKASRLRLGIAVKPRHLEIYYEDNGVGFVIAEQMQKGERQGLRSVKSRVEMLGGKLKYRSDPGVGTIYSITIPINLHEQHN